MRRGRPILRPKPVVLIACEGKSEVGYVRWLELTVFSQISFHPADVGKGRGNDYEKVKAAVDMIQARQRARRPYDHCAILLDGDRTAEEPRQTQSAKQLAEKNDLMLVVRRPTHEAFLLRHFDGYRDHQPATAADALNRLQKVWPAYEKGLTAEAHKRALQPNWIDQVCAVEPDFAKLIARLQALLPNGR